MKNVLVSIIIVTKNAGIKFKTVLKSVFSQGFKSFEVIIIDSGSKDDTLKVAKKYPIKIIKIHPEEYGHGKTRNFGMNFARGKYLVYLTQDAVPKNRNWLSNLIKNFSDEKIVGVYGRQIPNKDTNPLEKFSYLKDYPNVKKILDLNNYSQDEIIFANVNSAIRKKILLKNKFINDVIQSEDCIWAYEMLKKGYKIAYDPKATVIHSHNNNLFKAFSRFFDTGVSYNKIYSEKEFSSLVNSKVSLFLEKINYLFKNGYYLWILYAPIYELAKFLGLNLGRKEKIIPNFIKKLISLNKVYWRK
jgi:rhamnosyltransferase